MNFLKTFIVCFDMKADGPVMVVGTKPKGKTVIVERAIKGDEVIDIYEKITGTKYVKNGESNHV